jgi:NAD(P)H-hydrate repair Nnr-like enzyme with NAD(P)H-hydrate dehydratase domain
MGCTINRKLGEKIKAKPNTQISEIINTIPEVLKEMGL